MVVESYMQQVCARVIPGTRSTTDRYGDTVINEQPPVEFACLWLPQQKYVRVSTGEFVLSVGFLTLPATSSVTIGDYIVINTIRYQVIVVEPIADFGIIEHYDVYLGVPS